jgi:predicted O-linked N-acetylglucosamine transferase (SPINDLY family)
MLPAVGLSELVTSDTDQYLQRAVDVASDLPKLSAARNSLRGKLAPLLSDGRAHTVELEKAYRNMWLRWRETNCPQAAPILKPDL